MGAAQHTTHALKGRMKMYIYYKVHVVLLAFCFQPFFLIHAIRVHNVSIDSNLLSIVISRKGPGPFQVLNQWSAGGQPKALNKV